MKKFLFVLLASVAVTPAVAQNWDYTTNGANTTVYQQQRTTTTTTYQQPVYNRSVQNQRPVVAPKQVATTTEDYPYRLGNPLYHPKANKGVFGTEAKYTYQPKKTTTLPPQNKETEWMISPSAEIGVTDKLSVTMEAGYGQRKIKSGIQKGAKRIIYSAEAGLRYLIASADGFDFNVGAGAYYQKGRNQNKKNHETAYRSTGVDVSMQVGKKIENVTPYFKVGFLSDFWTKNGNANGTQTYINPGIYIDLMRGLSLDLSYESVTHGNATYQAMFDIYPQSNTKIGLGAFLVHPTTEANSYGAKVDFKIGF